MKLLNIISSVALGLFLNQGAFASEIRYTPINPTFGGNPFNSSHLLARAEAQKKYKEETAPQNSQEAFERTITSSILSRSALEIADRIFTTPSGQGGTQIIGNTRFDYLNLGTGFIRLTITDLSTGATTVVEVPESSA